MADPKTDKQIEAEAHVDTGASWPESAGTIPRAQSGTGGLHRRQSLGGRAGSARRPRLHDLGERVGIKMNFRDQGINEQDYMQKTEEIAYPAYEDQCTLADPRLAVVSDFKEILGDAYYGYKERPGRLK